MKRLLIALLASLPCWSQISNPVLGYFPDGGRIRIALGMPAASAVQPAVSLDASDPSRKFARIAVSPRQDYVLASAADSGEVSLFRPGQRSGQALTRLAGAGLSPDTISFSPGGGVAVLWFAATTRAQIFKGLPDAPEMREIDATFLAISPFSLAVSDDAEWLAGAWPGGVYAFGPHGEVTVSPVEGPARSVAFFHGTHDLAVANAQGVFAVLDAGGRAEVRSLFAAVETTLDPMALALTARNQRVVLAESSGRIISIEIQSGSVTFADCGCAPEGLDRVSRSAFRLTGLKERAFKLFDADTGEVLYSPLTEGEADGEEARQ